MKINYTKLYGVLGKILCGCGGAVVGLFIGGIVSIFLGFIIGIALGHILEKSIVDVSFEDNKN